MDPAGTEFPAVSEKAHEYRYKQLGEPDGKGKEPVSDLPLPL